MNTKSNYNGLVTFKFFDKNGNLKATHQKHNQGTPYLFSVITDILENGTTNVIDNRPGKIMLTTNGEVHVTSESGAYKLTYDGTPQLRVPLPKISATSSVTNDLYDNDSTKIPVTTPCLRYEFHISSYDLTASNGISNLTDYRFWLLSANENTFSTDGIVVDSDDSSASMENFLGHITYDNVIRSNDVPKICAEVQIQKNNDKDYSLNEGEYVSVLWDMYFSNNQSGNNQQGE